MNGEPIFLAQEVGEVLGYKDLYDNLRHSLGFIENIDYISLSGHNLVELKDLLRLRSNTPLPSQLYDTIKFMPSLTILTESGLNAVILKSTKPEALKYRIWVTKDVLPSIRKTGSYSIQPQPQVKLPAFLLRACANFNNVSPGYFSVINETFSILYAAFEIAGLVIPDRSVLDKELRPDISVGKVYKRKFLELHPGCESEIGTYKHKYPGGLICDCCQYPDAHLGEFRVFLVNTWMPEFGVRYFYERSPELLKIIPKLFLKSSAYKQIAEVTSQYTLKLETKERKVLTSS